jgi:hypothetical protein
MAGWPTKFRKHLYLGDLGLSPLVRGFFAKLETAYDAGIKHFHHWNIGKWWRAELWMNKEDLTVRIFPRDSFLFEFFTTGYPVSSGSITAPGFGTRTTVKAACIGVDVELDMNAIQITPRINKGMRSVDGTQLSVVQRPFQIQLINEPVCYPIKTEAFGRPKYHKALYRSYAPLHSHTGVHITSYNWGLPDANYGSLGPPLTFFTADPYGHTGAAQPLDSFNLRDVGFDVPFMQGDRDNPVQFGLLNDGTVDWPRSTGVMTVTDPTWGTREFAIYIDAFSQFSTFPTGDIGAPNGSIQNVQASHTRTVKPTLPGWVYQMASRFIDYYAAHSDPGLTAFAEIDWKVHPDGTKACAVVYSRVGPAVWDTTYFTALSAYPALSSLGALARCGLNSGDNTNPRYVYGTGLLEVTISITLTGPDPNDYTFTVSDAVAIRDPNTADYCTLLAGYTYHDIPNTTGGFYAKRGDMCVWDIERYYRYGPIDPYYSLSNLLSGVVLSSIYTEDDTKRTLYSLKNLTSNQELQTLPGFPSGVISNIPEPYNGNIWPQDQFDTNWSLLQTQFLDFNMETLSYVMKLTVQLPSQDHDSGVQFLFNNNQLNAGSAGPELKEPRAISHTSVAVYTFNQLRKQLFPNTMPLEAQVVSKAALANDFRFSYVLGAQWIFMPLQDNPDWTVTSWPLHPDWATNDMLALRDVCTKQQISSMTHIDPQSAALWTSKWDQIDPPTSGGTLQNHYKVIYWWLAHAVHALPTQLAYVLTPMPGWYMYSDLIMGAMHKGPWSTFFVHPNGTWAFFDQSIIYNPQGVYRSYPGDISFVSYDTIDNFDQTKLEHCIFDWVHFEFTGSHGNKVSKDTSFLALYNDAILQGQKEKTIVPGETFTPMTYAMMQATFSAPAVVPIVEISGVEMNWPQDATTYGLTDRLFQNATSGIHFHGIGGGALRALTTQSLWTSIAGSPASNAYHITFSSCLLIDS